MSSTLKIPLLQIVTKTGEVPEVPPFNDKFVENPVVAQRQISMVQTVQRSIEIPQLQYCDEVIDVLAVSVVQVPRVGVVKKTVEDPQFPIVEKTFENPETRTIQGLVVQAPLVQVMAKTERDGTAAVPLENRRNPWNPDGPGPSDL